MLQRLFAEIPMIKSMEYTPEELQVFEKHLVLKNYGRKEPILAEGENERSFRFMIQGIVREYYTHNNREINVRFAERNDMVCSFASYMSGKPSSTRLEAIEPSTLIIIGQEGMDEVMSRGLRFLQLGKEISARLFQQQADRERELLNYDALGRLQHFKDTRPVLFASLPQVFIASYLNIQPETFSALKKKLRYE